MMMMMMVHISIWLAWFVYQLLIEQVSYHQSLFLVDDGMISQRQTVIRRSLNQYTILFYLDLTTKRMRMTSINTSKNKNKNINQKKHTRKITIYPKILFTRSVNPIKFKHASMISLVASIVINDTNDTRQYDIRIL